MIVGERGINRKDAWECFFCVNFIFFSDNVENRKETNNISCIFIKKSIMAEYRISGVWKNANNVITDYAFHTVGESSISRATKKTKAQAIALLEVNGNSAITWVWDYSNAAWKIGETVQVINGNNGKYLRSNPDNKLTDNLEHLIDFDWIAP